MIRIMRTNVGRIENISLKKIFLYIRDLCKQECLNGKNIDNKIFAVIENEKLICNLQYKENKHNHPQIKGRNHGFWDYNYESLELLDFTFINKFDTFIFSEIEEYTFYLIECINKIYPPPIQHKRIISLDDISKKIWPEIKYINKKDINSIPPNCCFVCDSYQSQFVQFLSDNRCICNSFHLMHSITWMRNRSSLGSINKDKTLFLIEYPSYTSGLMDIVRCTCALVVYARRRNWFPVVHLSQKPNQYLVSEDDNMWEYFFEPTSRIPYNEVLQSYNVFETRKNNFELADYFIHPLLMDYDNELCWFAYERDVYWIKSILRINFDTMRVIHSLMPKKILNSNMIGVICRGTDYSSEANVRAGRLNTHNSNVDIMLEACNRFLSEYKCDYIFLATEDESIFNTFLKYFKDKLLYINQKRVFYDYKNNEYVPVSALLDIDNGKKFGQEYLTTLYCLGKCQILLSSMYCGAFIGAKLFCDSYFKKVMIV